jgi:hypothetical protein
MYKPNGVTTNNALNEDVIGHMSNDLELDYIST